MNELFDLIVVGAGSAGAVIAARASEDPRRSVLLVEAGPDYPNLETLPFDLVNSHNNSYSAHDWGLRYRPTAAGRPAPLPRGRVTGGSSAVNTTIALRGVPEDYDGWAAAGNPEWAWERVLPAFRRLERDLDFGDRPYHGDAGPITIRRYTREELTPVQQAWLETADELGFPRCDDANDPFGWGAGPHPMNKVGRLRISTAIGYLAPARARPNLRIQPNTLTRRILFEGRRAVGIEVERDGQVERLRARLVVLSAGAIHSPAILLRSGIGPADELSRLGVEPVHIAPGVGTRLSDHPALAVVATVRDPRLLDPDQPIVQTILRYTAPDSPHRNDLQVEAFSFSPRANQPLQAIAVAAVLEQVNGTGTLRLPSADPHAPPIIENHFCEDPEDRRRLRACFRDAIRFVTTGPLGALVDSLLFPDPGRELTDEALDRLLLRLAASGYHPCATAPMGPPTDPGAVVDQYGLVYGVESLAVADASIMPTVPRANTNLSTIMIGEMVGEWIRTQPARYGL
ncbi:MAG: glucose-methanol-choline oxidoreductase [Tepidiforma sp.]|nr:MAG: glucose-methanol-choline oxidoreductase [Tepidiforma sp.]